MPYNILSVTPIAGALGATIGGVDLARDRGAQLQTELLRALHEYKVITIHGQQLDADDLMRIGSVFGPPCAYPFAKGIDGFEYINDVVKAETERNNFGNDWHIDSIYLQQPPLATLLYSIQTPAYGGDTLFADAESAYEALSAGMKRLLDGLIGITSSSLKFRKGGARQAYLSQFSSMQIEAPKASESFEARHPVVRTHPATGRKSLYVSPLHTLGFEGFTEEESRPIIEFLCAHLLTPEFGCRVRWVPGQLTIWDNRNTLHCAINDYQGKRRHMRRLTVGPEQPI
ncbi:TauD/TfdA dioxygenase family protein [Xanthomonas graminis]|uniref:TauD/TfdA-like domain-containing protein n=1 Tax=Xanthomonas graminis pv. poae TaxID=227946 RepID=A0A199NXV3_9XANT|nr:TauD/TfdA family dioxygenase [Xanthomonas translucens]OAX53483.1 hypothetical protein A6R73_07150 [Xanthomonas translucens pv. poae]